MKQTPCSARPYIRTYAELLNGPKTADDLAIKLGVTAQEARRYLRFMRSVRLLKITNPKQRVNIPRIFAIGEDESRKKSRVPVSLISFAAFLKAMETPKSARELAEETGLHLNTVHTWVNLCRQLKIIRIGDWSRTGGTVWAANYVIGFGGNKAKPKPEPEDELAAKRNEVKRRKRAMQKLIKLTSGLLAA